jgi:PAS domain S-box-containing protein
MTAPEFPNADIAYSGGAKRFWLADLPVPMVYATHRIIRDCNFEFAQEFGYERDELIDQSFSRLYPKIRDFVRTGEMWRTNFAGGRVYYDERVMRRRCGSSFWCRVRGRSRNQADPFAEALYCFEPMNRAVAGNASLISDRRRDRPFEAHHRGASRPPHAHVWSAQQCRTDRLVLVVTIIVKTSAAYRRSPPRRGLDRCSENDAAGGFRNNRHRPDRECTARHRRSPRSAR